MCGKPWTANEIVKADKAYTDGIMDCTAGGITDGKDVVMFHICPTMQENRDFDNISKTLKEKLNLKSPNLRGFIIGCVDRYQDSVNNFNKLKRFMTDLKIPTTAVKGSRDASTNIVYNAQKDEWLISNNEINHAIYLGEKNPKTLLERCYKEIEISPKDHLTV